MRQRRRGDRLIPEAADQRKIGGHHRDLPELRQRHRHRQPQRLGQLQREVIAGHRRPGRSAPNLFKDVMGATLAPGWAKRSVPTIPVV